MIIGALDKLTLLDYPGELAAIVFTKGCNFRCDYCYNPMLVVPGTLGKASEKDYPPNISEGDLFSFLKIRFGKIDAVVITGGEPTIHKDLPDFIEKIKNIGYKVKLDTNGTNPDVLEYLLKKELIDYVAMDIKSSLEKYSKVINTEVELSKIQKSVKILLDENILYEFRTTTLPRVHSLDDFHGMGELINGARLWYIQDFEGSTSLINPEFRKEKSFSNLDLNKVLEIGSKYVQICKLR